MFHRAILILFILTTPLLAQRERQISPPAAEDSTRYGRQFFVQLRSVFGRFRDTDLQRAFEKAKPIQCSELVNEPGEWRTVAFFNERRELGDWYRANFDEVKRDLSVFIFKGVCRGDHAPVQLTTKFPVSETVEAFNNGRIGLDEVDVNVNAAVRASFDSQTQAYSFDLPYLFLVSHQDDGDIYSLSAPTLAGRDRYAIDVIDHWDCKSVTAENVTYQFLICRTTTQPRNRAARNAGYAAFGASAYFILSDGKEASSNVKLSFTDDNDKEHNVVDTSTKEPDLPQPPATWEMPDPEEKLLDVLRDEFRIHFNPQTWTGRMGTSQVLSSQKLSSLDAYVAIPGVDSCVWLPSRATEVVDAASYVISVHEADARSPLSINFDLKSITGQQMGSLQCFFPRATSPLSITVARWTSVVGRNLALEVRP
jgi:hypothetical protein